MKLNLIALSLYTLTFINVYGQKFVSDSVCYENMQTNTKIRCEIPTLDPGTSSYYKDLWEVERNGDFIKIVHWYSKPVKETFINSNGDTIPTLGRALTTRFNIQYRDEETSSMVSLKIKVSSQLFQGIASDGSKEFALALGWRLYDLNNDGKWDRLALTWMEPNSPISRTIFCHFK
jgi:hypothetical protein